MEKHDQSLHEKFVAYGTNAKEWMRKCVLLLPEINARAIWKQKGFGSIYEYAAKLAGMSRNTVDNALRILEKIEDKPYLRLVAEHKGLGAIRPVITVATPDDEKFWARKAAAMSKNTLETYVREYRRQKEFAGCAPFDAPAAKSFNPDFRPGTEFRVKEERAENVKNGSESGVEDQIAGLGTCAPSVPAKIILAMDLEPEVAAILQKLKGQGDWNMLMKELLALREEKLTAEAPEPIEDAKRYIPVRIKRYVLKKTNGQCAYPGCTKPYRILHHTQRFALRPTHDSKTLVPLCKAHERLAHQGLIEHEQEGPENWRVRDEAERDKVTYAVDRRVMVRRKF